MNKGSMYPPDDQSRKFKEVAIIVERQLNKPKDMNGSDTASEKEREMTKPTKQEIIEACARFMGWLKRDAEFEANDFYLIPNPDGKTGKVGPSVADYDPTAGTPEGLKQAKELRKKLYAGGYCVNMHSKNTVVHKVTKTGLIPVASGIGTWWNTTLSEAVYNLQTEIERKENE